MSPNTITTPVLPTSDLRSEAKAYKRDKSHTTKWARGGRVAPGRSCPHNPAPIVSNAACNQCVARPLNRDSTRNYGMHYFQRAERASIHANKDSHRQGNIAKKVLQNDLNEVTLNSDTGSSDEEVAAISEAPIPHSEVMYSYDAQSGPSTGSDVLSIAVMQAVKRFENKETEKLVKNEYDLMPDVKEMEDAYAGDAEDDFEVIEYEHLH